MCLFIGRTCLAQDFPKDFKFGAATASYQVEGGWNSDDKGENIWDRLLHSVSIPDKTSGDVAADSYHLWRSDVDLVSQLGLQFYRFSISWSRLLPTGLANKVSVAGAKYYSDLIDELIRRGIEPVVTIYHFDLPTKIQDLGGWTNPLIADWFEDYARIVFSLYADRVKTWLTINEPIVICDLGYNLGHLAPPIKETELAPFLCNKNVIMAHAKAYRVYEREFKAKYQGRISLPNNLIWIDPVDSSAVELAKLGMEYMVGRYSHAIHSKEGGWPKAVEEQLLKYSLEHGFRKSKLPAFTEEEKALARGTADFYGLNYYTARVIRPAHGAETGPWFTDGSPEIDAILGPPPNAKTSATPVLPLSPVGLRKILSYIKQEYGDIEIFITENGYAGGKEFSDYNRTEFIRDHLEQVLLAIKEDHVNVSSYTYWSLFDAFEWGSGYTLTFGLYDLDYNDPSKPRTARLSARYYGCVVKGKSLNVTEKCTHNSIVSKLGFQIENNSRRLEASYVFLILYIVFIIAYR